MKKIIIIGGGIGGLCTAIALFQKGFEVRVYDSATDHQPIGAGLVLAANAMKALRELGIGDEILRAGKCLEKLQILAQDGKIIVQTDTTRTSRRFGTDNFAIHRADLHRILRAHLPAQALVLGKKCMGLEQTPESVRVGFADGSTDQAACLVAADGIHSTIRRKLLPAAMPRYAGYTCWRAVTPVYPDDFNPDTFSETWSPAGRFGIVPLSDHRIYWYACLNASAKDPEMARWNTQELAGRFKNHHAPIPQLIRQTSDSNLIHGDIIDLAPIRKFAFGNVVLTGDAGHATTPNLGQGACQAIEDALVLARCLAREEKVATALIEFERKRIGRTTKIVNDSYRLGRIAQWTHPLLCHLRNQLLRLVPQRINDKRLAFLYDVDFN